MTAQKLLPVGQGAPCGSNLQVTFNESAGKAVLEGTVGAPDNSYTYRLGAVEQNGNEVHVDVELVTDGGAALCSVETLPVNDQFVLPQQASDVYVHVKYVNPEWMTASGKEEKREVAVLHCRKGAAPKA